MSAVNGRSEATVWKGRVEWFCLTFREYQYDGTKGDRQPRLLEQANVIMLRKLNVPALHQSEFPIPALCFEPKSYRFYRLAPLMLLASLSKSTPGSDTIRTLDG